jgi:hypothetical protein
VLAPLLVGRAFCLGQAAFAEMTARTAVLAIQSGEPGPIARRSPASTSPYDMAARRRPAALAPPVARRER